MNGVMEGYGRMKLPNADEYVGQFRAGKANGTGRYVDVTGESFEGSFLNGLRDGRGITRLPDGTSYRSSWAAGEETEGSRAVRVSQAGAPRAPGGSDDVRVAVELPQPSPYVASSAGPVLSIAPDENTVKIWKGDGDISSGEANMLRFGIGAKSGLRLRVGIQNRSTRALQVAGIFFDVQSSASDLQPAIQAKVGRQNVCGNSLYGPTVEFWNFGWSAAENATLRLAFTSSASTEIPTRFDYAKKLGRIDKTAKTDLEPEIAAAGVNTALLRSRADRTLSCRAKDEKRCLAELKASGIFGSLAALVTEEPAIRAVGKLEYEWTEANGNKRKRSSKLEGILQLGHLTPPSTACAEEAAPETQFSRPVSFKLDQSQYRLSTGIPARAIPAGRTNWLDLKVVAERSSHHEFRLVVQMADGRELTSRQIKFSVLRAEPAQLELGHSPSPACCHCTGDRPGITSAGWGASVDDADASFSRCISVAASSYRFGAGMRRVAKLPDSKTRNSTSALELRGPRWSNRKLPSENVTWYSPPCGASIRRDAKWLCAPITALTPQAFSACAALCSAGPALVVNSAPQ